MTFHNTEEGSAKAIDITPNQDGGVLKEILKEGVGEEIPGEGCKVYVHYVGKLLDETVFDSSRERDEKFDFSLGVGNVIKGWDIGVATMKRGEIALLTCRSDYAYGDTGSPPKIPGGATLIFEVELFHWKGEDLSPQNDGGIIRNAISKGQGFTEPNEGATVEVHIKGTCDDRIFDERDVTFCLGEGAESNICKGIEIALEKFKNKEKSSVILQPQFAFGTEGNVDFQIPGNAQVKYEIELKNFEKAKDHWELDSNEKLEQAKLFKEKGGNFFKLGKYDLASKQYKKIVTFLDFDGGVKDEQKVEYKSVLVAGYLNLALCDLKVEEFLQCLENCNKALEQEPDNAKGLFRRGQAYIGLSEPLKAKLEFESVLKIEPNNKAAQNHVAISERKIQDQIRKEKKLYANMFDKFAKIDQEKEDADKKNQPDVMSKLGDWGEGQETIDVKPLEKEIGSADELLAKEGVLHIIDTNKDYGCVAEEN